MRHGKKVNHLSRTKSHRDALLSNMAVSLIKAKRIETTLAKATSLRMYVEPLITKSKADNTHSRRTVFSYLQDKEAIKILFGEIAEKVAERNGGYTRIIKLGQRQGDNAVVALIELVDFNENLLTKDAAETEAKAKRSRRGKSKKSETVASEAGTSAEVVEEAPVAEVVEEAPVAEVVSEVASADSEKSTKEEGETPAETEEKA
ncbi:MAG: 50S ribosomal protein L17 [Cytophagaceae bacterium]|nr:50S ribosomal protein L17 [Cytophagaceae bacterium]